MKKEIYTPMEQVLISGVQHLVADYATQCFIEHQEELAALKQEVEL